MKKITDSFQAKGADGCMYTVNVWTTMVPYKGRQLEGGREHLLKNGDELINVSGTDNQWDIASTNVRITAI